MQNTIKVILTEFGGIHVMSIPLKIYKDSYNTTNIECLLPKTEYKKSLLKMYASSRDNLGNKVWTSQTYNLVYKKDIVYNKTNYEVYEAMLPKEFCKVNGHLEVTFTHTALTNEDTVERLLTTGTINLYIDGVGNNNAGVVISPYDITATKVNQLVKEMEEVKDWTAADIPLLKAGRLSYENVQEALNSLEQEKADRKQVDRELERLEGKLDTGIDQEEVENNVVKKVVPLIDKGTIGIDKVDNTADIDKPVSTLQQEAITRATSTVKEELTESLIALNDRLTNEIAKKEESITEKIIEEQTARMEEDTSITTEIGILQEKNATVDRLLEELQVEIKALKEDREQIIKDAKLQAYPIGITIYSEDSSFNPITDIGGNWEETEAPITSAGANYWTRSLKDIIGSYGNNTVKSFIAEYDGQISILGTTVFASNNTIAIQRYSDGKYFKTLTDGVAGEGWGTSAYMSFKKGDSISVEFRNVNPNFGLCNVQYIDIKYDRKGRAWKRLP